MTAPPPRPCYLCLNTTKPIHGTPCPDCSRTTHLHCTNLFRVTKPLRVFQNPCPACTLATEEYGDETFWGALAADATRQAVLQDVNVQDLRRYFGHTAWLAGQGPWDQNLPDADRKGQGTEWEDTYKEVERVLGVLLVAEEEEAKKRMKAWEERRLKVALAKSESPIPDEYQEEGLDFEVEDDMS